LNRPAFSFDQFSVLADRITLPRPRRAKQRNLTPADVCEAVDGVRLSVTRNERSETVARIVRRRQRASVRVREEATP
jgi:hypothetical protein